MPEITQENVQPLIANVEAAGRRVAVQFRCPASGQVVPAQYNAGPKAQNRMAQSAKRSMMYEVRRAVGPMLRSVFGHNVMGRMASQMADSAMRNASSGVSRGSQGLSAAEQKEAILEAFRTVSSQFVWDGSNARWIAASAARDLMSPFELQLADGPVEAPYDRQVLARMLVEVAAADGTLVESERNFMTEFLTPEVGSLETLMERPPLTRAELGSTTRGATRGTLLMLAWVLALSDEDFDPAEASKLDHFSNGLGLVESQAMAMREAAQGFLMDQALERMFTWGGHDAHAREQMYALAGKLGMSRDAAEEAEARYQRRKNG